MSDLPAYIEAHRTDATRVETRLVRIDLVDPDESYYLTTFDRDISWDGHTWLADGVTVSRVASNADRLASASVSLLNPGNVWGAIVWGFAGTRRTPIVTVYEAWPDLSVRPVGILSASGEDAVFVVCKGIAERPRITVTDVTFGVTNGTGPRTRKTPPRQIGTSCTIRRYKSPQCGSASGDLTCSRQYGDCQTKGNRLRFGGWMALPRVDGQYYFFGGEKLDLGRL